MEPSQEGVSKKLKIALASLIILLHVSYIQITMVILFFVLYNDIVSALDSLTDWVSERPVGGIILIMVCFISGITIMMPISFFIFVLAIQCQNLLGGVLGYITCLFLVYFCTASGSTLAFLLSRFLLKKTLLSSIKPNWFKTRAVLRALEHNGFKIVLLLRLAPIVPFSLLNYALGASSVSIQDYIFASIGLLPKQALIVYVAVSVGSLKEAVDKETGDTTQMIIILVVGSVFGIIAAVYLTIVAKREFNKIIQETQPILGDSEEHKSSVEGE